MTAFFSKTLSFIIQITENSTIWAQDYINLQFALPPFHVQ